MYQAIKSITCTSDQICTPNIYFLVPVASVNFCNKTFISVQLLELAGIIGLLL